MKTLTAAIEGLKGKPEKVVRGTIISLFGRIVKETPVDEGRLKGNWQITFDAPAKSQTGNLDPDGDMTEMSGVAAMSKYDSGKIIYFTNNLPYAERIEYGYSNQAPSGMVRVAIAQLEAAIKEGASKA